MNFDIMDTVAGRQVFEEGVEKGIEQGIEKGTRDMVIRALTERFVAVPAHIRDEVHSVKQHETLEELFRHAIRSPDIEEFKKVLSKVSSAS